MKDIELNNDLLKKEILKLKNELNIEKDNNKKLSRRIKDLEKKIYLKGENNLTEKSNLNVLNDNLISDLHMKLKNLNNNLNNNLNKDRINELLDELRKKDKIISNYPVQLLEGEKLLSVLFVSMDQKLHYSVICKNTDIFNTIENKLYQSFPEYTKTENIFYVDGNKVDEGKNLDFNNIKNNDIILLQNI